VISAFVIIIYLDTSNSHTTAKNDSFLSLSW